MIIVGSQKDWRGSRYRRFYDEHSNVEQVLECMRSEIEVYARMQLYLQ